MSRFYTADDFDVVFTREVKPGFTSYFKRKKCIATVRIGETAPAGYTEVRLNPRDKWACPETPQQRRAAKKVIKRKVRP